MNESVSNENVTNNNSDYVPRMRTIPKAYQELLKLDPDTSLSMRGLRDLVSSGQIPTITIKNRVLINLDLLIQWLSCYNDSATCA